ncbi:MAG: T9SS type A sorting domain-containing protein [Bacteroidia bacterium]
MKTILTTLLSLLIAAVLLPLSAFGQLTLVEWNFPNNPDDAVADAGIPANLAKTISTTGGTGTIIYINNGVTTRSAWADGWHNGSGSKAWEIEFSTLGYYDIDLTSRQQSSGTGPRDFKIQYKVGAAGTYVDLYSPITISNATGWFGPSPQVALPPTCDDQSSIYIRWIMTSNVSQSGGTVASGGASRIDDIIVRAKATNDYYRSVVNGNWDNISVWEASPDNISWFPAELRPSYYARTITVRNPHTVTSSSAVTIDETIIEAGATLDYFSGTITLNNGAGVDLQINGTFVDQSSSVIWAGGATWLLGANATYMKTSGGSAAVWRDNYQGGISNIPATANWIVRKNSASNPSVVTVGGMYYPNLTFENYTAGTWITGPTSSFAGNTNFPTIKGNFDIGGAGTSTVDFTNDNANATPTQVQGNMIVRTGNFARNNGTGYEINGNLTVDGTITYGVSNNRRLVFSGGNNQTISGGGIINVYQMIVNKSANDLTLLKPITVDFNLTLNNGRIFSSNINILTISSVATVTGTSNLSFVHGPVAKTGSAGFIFPVGKNNDYQAIEMGTGTDVNDIFIAEYFLANPQIVFGNNLDPTLDHISQCEYWTLDRMTGISSRTVRLTWDANSCGITFLPDLHVARFDGTTWKDHGNGGTTGNTSAGTVVSSSVLSSFGPFTLSSVSSQNPLPVELIHFSARVLSDVVKIEWTTASEKNNDYFEVQRSGDGFNFEVAGIVKGAGNSTTINHYEFLDLNPLNGVSYYRLRQIDYDGTDDISPSVSVRFLAKHKVNIYPNPANGIVTVSATSEVTQIKIISASGQVVLSQTFDSEAVINLSTLAPGFYFCELSGSNSPLYVEKLLIAR